MQSNQLNENIKHNDLNALIQPIVSIDQYKSKIGDDANIVVVAFKVLDIDPAKDLSQFLESGHPSALDVDISPGPDPEGNYTVYVELDRNSRLYDVLEEILTDVQRVDNNIKEFMFTSYKEKMPKEWSKENFEQSVITSSYDYTVKYNPDAVAISERIKFLNKY
jgi:hypothetical protein